jgi:hypothetical protein
MNKFEQLIEFVINDEADKARELFHDIVVEKSREIYENLMDESEEADEEELDEAACDEEDDSEELDENFGGDATDDLIQDVETEEEGIQLEDGEEEFDSEEEVEFDGEEESVEGDIEDRVVDLEDKLDELMAEFESLMGSDEEVTGVELDAGEGGDALSMDDTEEFSDVSELDEAVSLQAAPKPVTSEEGNINKRSTTAFNSGAAGMAAKPVHAGANEGGKHDAPGAYSNQTKDLIGKVQNSVGGKKSLSAATKPTTTQASGVNTKSPVPKA